MGRRHLHWRQRGVAIIAVVWLLTLMCLIVGSLVTSLRRQTNINYALVKSAKTAAECQGLLNTAVYMLKNPVEEKRLVGFDRIYQLRDSLDPTQYSRIKVSSEAGKIDINTTESQYLQALLKAANVENPDKLVQALEDWRDFDDEPLPKGAEKDAYSKRNYWPQNQNLASVEELRYVMGFTPEIIDQIRPWITVYSGESALNFDFVSMTLMDVLERNLEDNSALESYKQDKEARENSEDKAPPDINNMAFTVAVGRKGPDAACRIEAVLRVSDYNGKLFELLEWKQGKNATSLFENVDNGTVIEVDNEFEYRN